MGLGIITGAVAITRTATMSEIKSEDLSWIGVPNAMTRIFEVNLGNIAASVPILKPFARYVHARISGSDPHQILRRKHSEPEEHEKWYRRNWRTPSHKVDTELGSQPKKNKLPPGALQLRATGTKGAIINTEASRSGSLELPVQGVQKECIQEYASDIFEDPDLSFYNSNGTPASESGETLHVKLDV